MTSTISRPAVTRAMPDATSPGGTQDTQQAIEQTVSVVPPPAGADAAQAQVARESVPPMLGSLPGLALAPTADSRPTIGDSMPKDSPSGGTKLAGRHVIRDTHSQIAASDQPADRQFGLDAHERGAAGSDAGQDQAARAQWMTGLRWLLDPALALAADVLDDIERVRTANENRLRQLTRSVEDVDGELRGFGLDESHPDVARLSAMVETLKKVEHDATLQLQRQMRRHPLYAWTKSMRGVGDKQVARLLAAIGDPYINSATGMPRTVSALWAYCGLHVLPAVRCTGDAPTSLDGGIGGDPGQILLDDHPDSAGVAPKRQRGQRANWSTKAKTRAYLIATSCLKQLVKPCTGDEHVDDCACSPYRVAYDRRRAHTAVTRPDWTDGHSHNDALRVVSKAVLRDLWREAKRIHEERTTP